ncbi:MAG: DUF4826 family protein [Xanthomonadales bacterium]|nr:DUF4826 family protein [Gammaproteobacteria bacterium]MBT8053403.1 DUF4826 family protein [Gammaproteobacteria bacterium]NNK52088.1 DUF4826 family protein [Xanthomonadales bacterium]
MSEMTESKATETNAGADQEALKAWYKGALDKVVREMVKNRAVESAAVEAAAVWMVPNRILIAKVWEASQNTQFIWTISGDAVVTDHIKGSLATTPREAARHFSLKWQMDAERVLSLAKSKTPSGKPEPHLEAHSQKLIRNAEALYDLTTVDDFWKEV